MRPFPAYVETVSLIKGLAPEIGKNFHLSPCGGCLQPSWEQPCPFCGFYPEYGVPALWNKKHKEECRSQDWNKEKWIERVLRHQNIGRMFFSRCKQVVAYSELWEYREKVDSLILQCESISFPDLNELYDEVFARHGEVMKKYL